MDYRLLVVDDDILIRSHIEEALRPLGFNVKTVEDGKTALAVLDAESFDAVLLDQLLPDSSGIEVLQQIQKLPDPPTVVLLTAHGSVEAAVDAMKLGAYDYVKKPYQMNELEALLRRACEKNRLSREVTLLKRAIAPRSVPALAAHSDKMNALMHLIKKGAPTDSTVLIQGETGTGKELVANEIYRRSLRSGKPFLPVNCGALQEQLLESELFGHEKGSFTGAAGTRPGLFEVADGGTIFLDEIGEMPQNTQVKLLRVLQSGEIRKVGGNRIIHVNVRVIASTNKNLSAETKAGHFREDLFYRLSVLTIHVPALRERKEEIPYLVDQFLSQACARMRTPLKKLSADAMAVLQRHDWPGNVRELENIIELAVVLSDGAVIKASDLPQHLSKPEKPESAAATESDGQLSLEEVETQHLLRTLEANRGNKRKTARELGIDTKTLYNKLKRLNIQ